MGDNGLSREWILIDERRRLTIPKKFIDAIGLTKEQLKEKYPILVEAYPNLEECKTILIKKR